MIDNKMCESTQNKFMSKNLVKCFFKEQSSYTGQQNSAIFFKRHINETCLIIIQQYFALNGQMKILKKWQNLFFYYIAFMHKSNQFIITTESDIFITKIEGSYNLTIVESIFTFKDGFKVSSPFEGFLVVSENDNQIVVFIQKTIYFLIKDDGNWMLQQKEKIDFEVLALILDSKLNEEGNILIISFSQRCDYFLSVFLRAGGLWLKIKEFLFDSFPPQFCFLDDQKFLIFCSENHEKKLSTFQISQKTFKVKLLETQNLQISGIFNKLRYFAQRGFLIAQKSSFVYVIQQVNKEFKISSQMSIPGGLIFRDIINGESLFFSSSELFGKKYKTQVSKLYGK